MPQASPDAKVSVVCEQPPEQQRHSVETGLEARIPDFDKGLLRGALIEQRHRAIEAPRPRNLVTQDGDQSAHVPIMSSQKPYRFEYRHAAENLRDPHPLLADVDALTKIVETFDNSSILATTSSVTEAVEILNSVLLTVDPDKNLKVEQYLYQVRHLLDSELLNLPAADGGSPIKKLQRVINAFPNSSIIEAESFVHTASMLTNPATRPDTFDDMLADIVAAQDALMPFQREPAGLFYRLASYPEFSRRYSSVAEAAEALTELRTQLSISGIPLQDAVTAITVAKLRDPATDLEKYDFGAVKTVLEQYHELTGTKLTEFQGSLLPELAEIGIVRRESIAYVVEDLHKVLEMSQSLDVHVEEIVKILKGPSGASLIRSGARGAALTEAVAGEIYATLSRIEDLSAEVARQGRGATPLNTERILRKLPQYRGGSDLLEGLRDFERVLSLSPGIPSMKVFSISSELCSEFPNPDDRAAVARFLHSRAADVQSLKLLSKEIPVFRDIKPISKLLDVVADLCDECRVESEKPRTLGGMIAILNQLGPIATQSELALIPQQVKEFETAWGERSAEHIAELHRNIFSTPRASPKERLLDLAWVKELYPATELQRILTSYVPLVRDLYSSRDLSDRELIAQVVELAPRIQRLEKYVAHSGAGGDFGSISVEEILESIDAIAARPGGAGFGEIADNLVEKLGEFDRDVPQFVRLLWLKDGRDPAQFALARRELLGARASLSNEEVFSLASAGVPARLLAERPDHTIVEIISEHVQTTIRERVGESNFAVIKTVLEEEYGVKYFTADADSYIDTYKQDVLLRSNPNMEFPGGKVLFLSPEYLSDTAFLTDTAMIRDLKLMGFTVFVGGEPSQNAVLETLQRVSPTNSPGMVGLVISGHGTAAGIALRDGGSPATELTSIAGEDSGALSIADGYFFGHIAKNLSPGHSILILNACGSGATSESIGTLAAHQLQQISHVQAVLDPQTSVYGARRGRDGLPRLIFDSSAVVERGASRQQRDALFYERNR